MAKACGQLRGCIAQILPPEYVVPADTNGFHAYQYFSSCGRWARTILDLENVGLAELMKTNDAGHNDLVG